MTSARRKIDLYVLSLGLLFVFFFIISVKLPVGGFSLGDLGSWVRLLRVNILPLLSLFGLLYCVFAYLRFDFELEGAVDIPFEISKLEDINYEHLTFLATYVVPLISFDFDNGRQVVVLVLLLMAMGVIYVKTNLFYANPSLALLGFHIYRASGNFKNGRRDGVVLICRGGLVEGQRVSYIKLDDQIYYVRGQSDG